MSSPPVSQDGRAAGVLPAASAEVLHALIEAVRSVTPWRDANGIASYLDVSVKTVHRLSGPSTPESERMPCHSLGPNGEKRFDVREIDEWVRSRTRLAA